MIPKRNTHQAKDSANKSPMIWVVDDDNFVREATQMLFEIVGWRVRTFATGQAVLKSIEENGNPDCLLLDIRLPDLSGIEVFKQLLRLKPSVPTILISGDLDTLSKSPLIFRKATAVFRKPIAGEKLIDAIQSVLDRHS